MTVRFCAYRLSSVYDDVLELLKRTQDPDAGPIVGATDDEIRSLETAIGMSLPESLKSWLRVCRSSLGGEGGIYGTSQSHSEFLNIDARLDLYPTWRELGWIPIAGDGCGNQYVIVDYEGREAVAFIEAVVDPEQIAYFTATTLDIFLREMLHEMLRDEADKSGWPFDRNYVQRVDPDLLEISPNPVEVD